MSHARREENRMSDVLAGCRTELVPLELLPAVLNGDDVLAAYCFAEETSLATGDMRVVSIGLESLAPSKQVEIWRGSATVTAGQAGRVRYAEDGGVVFGHLLAHDDARMDIASEVEAMYKEIMEFLHASDYPYLFRCWNFISGINRSEAGLERYRAFCVGRYKAVSQAADFERTLPAASAIGTHTPGLLVSFAATRTRPLQIENPRQLSAFRYPPEYGPRSPLFSRAVWMDWQSSQRLYLSGTASILGHETVHADDVGAQAGETLRNVEAVLQNAAYGQRGDRQEHNATPCLRAYIRHSEHYAIVREVVESRWGREVPIVYLHGDICRSGLLLEIEGVFDGAIFDRQR